MLTLLFSLLFAQEPQVIVAPVRATETSQKAANKLKAQLEKQLRKDKKSIAILDQNVASVNEVDSAIDYLDSCMIGDGSSYRICVQLIAEANKWDYAISIEVRPLQKGYRVQTWIIDVFGSQEISTPDLDIEETGFEQWATIVSMTYQNILSNGIQKVDLRKQEELTDEELMRAVAKDMDDVQESSLQNIDKVFIERKDLTPADIDRLAEEDVPPWEEIGLTGKQYMEFYNTQNKQEDFTLTKWKTLMNGKLGMLSLNVGFGYSALPSKGYYYAYRVHPQIEYNTTIEKYAEQGLQNAGLGLIELSAGIGILPQLELAGFVGMGFSKFIVNLWWITVDVNQPNYQEWIFDQTITYYGGRANLSLPSLNMFKPALGLSVSQWLGTSGFDYFGNPALESEFPDLGVSSMIVLAVEPGGELRLGESVEMWIRFPISYSLLFNASSPYLEKDEKKVQSVADLQYYLDLQNSEKRTRFDEPFPLGFGGMLGLRINVPVFRPSFKSNSLLEE